MATLVDDRYELLEVLASGGMATVWQARDTRLGRIVALKRPHPAPAGSNTDERIEREARAAAGVKHPNLVTVFDTGGDEAGPYLVMELVVGPTLASPGREIEPAEAIDIGAQVADALATVHDAGIVHRDVKPSNVILSERGPCLTDFGIASIGGATRDITQPGTIMATPSYAAPEVLAGETPIPASDVFSLAAVVYELVSGKPPFQGAERSTPPVPLNYPQLDAVIRAGLATEPNQRPTAREMVVALRAAAPTRAVMKPNDTLPLSAPVLPAPPPEPEMEPRPPAPTSEPSEPSKEKPGLHRFMPVFLLLLLASILAVAWAAGSPETDPNIATTTDVVTTSSFPAATSPQTTVTLAVAVDPVLTARDSLAAILASIDPPELKPKERTEIMEKVDEALVAAGNDPASAEKPLREAREKIGKALDGDLELEALGALNELANALGIEFSAEGEEGD